jgi:hypothetical protein
MTNILSHSELFDTLYNAFKNNVSQIEHSEENFMDFLIKAMECVEHFSNSLKEKIHGLEKKELVKDILHKFLHEFDKDSGELHNMLDAIEIFVDKVIDVLVSAAKGQLHFNEAVKLMKHTCCAKPLPQQRIIKKPKDIAEMQTLMDIIYNEVKESIVNKTFGLNNVVVLITIVMQVVEKVKTLTGPEKKEVVITVIKRLLSEIEMALGKTIDYIIMAANGELDFGKMIEQAKSSFKTMFSCCFKKEVVVTQ